MLGCGVGSNNQDCKIFYFGLKIVLSWWHNHCTKCKSNHQTQTFLRFHMLFYFSHFYFTALLTHAWILSFIMDVECLLFQLLALVMYYLCFSFQWNHGASPWWFLIFRLVSYCSRGKHWLLNCIVFSTIYWNSHGCERQFIIKDLRMSDSDLDAFGLHHLVVTNGENLKI